MKKRLLQYLAIAAIFTTTFAGAHLESFNARTIGENVRLEWQTTEETNVKEFVIERKNGQGPFIEIASIEPKGNSLYIYIDESAYKSSSDLIFTYRLKIVENDGRYAYSAETSVSPNVSGIKRTWGSIKAMFR